MARPIRILHVIDKFTMDGVNPSSCSRLFAEWIPKHDPARFQVDVAGLRPRNAAGEYLEKQGIRVYYIAEGKFSPKNIRAIEQLAREGQYDILHLHGYSSANFGRIAARRLGIPSVMHEHAVLKVLPHQFVIDWLLRHKTDVAVAVSRAVKEFLMKGRSVPEHKIRVIWNGVPLQAFQNIDAEKVQAFRERLNLPEDATVIGTVTRLREEKGNRYFIEAAAQLRSKFPQVYYVLIGDGPLRQELEALSRQLGVDDRVVFAGFVAEVPPALAALDIVTMPSLREGFGLALAEAMAAGKPVVASNVGGLAELAEHEKTALLVPPADAGALAGALERLLADGGLRERLARAAREASSAFSIETNVAALEALYTELYENHRSQRHPEPATLDAVEA